MSELTTTTCSRWAILFALIGFVNACQLSPNEELSRAFGPSRFQTADVEVTLDPRPSDAPPATAFQGILANADFYGLYHRDGHVVLRIFGDFVVSPYDIIERHSPTTEPFIFESNASRFFSGLTGIGFYLAHIVDVLIIAHESNNESIMNSAQDLCTQLLGAERTRFVAFVSSHGVVTGYIVLRPAAKERLERAFMFSRAQFEK